MKYFVWGFVGLIVILLFLGNSVDDDGSPRVSKKTNPIYYSSGPIDIAEVWRDGRKSARDILESTKGQLRIESWRCYRRYSYFYIEGQVTNVSNRSLENVEAVGEFYTSDDTFVTADSALVEYNPILPGQSTPFKTMTRDNPAISSCSVKFKTLWGKQLQVERKNQHVYSLQGDLNDLGFSVGKPDGVAGPKTITAIKSFQEMAGLPVTGQASFDTAIDVLAYKLKKVHFDKAKQQAEESKNSLQDDTLNADEKQHTD